MYAGLTLLVLLWMALRWRYGPATWPRLPQPSAPWVVPACGVASAALFIAQLLTVAFDARHQIATECFMHLPVPVVGDFGQDTGGAAMLGPGIALTAYAILQSVLLATIYLAASRRKPTPAEWGVTGAAAIAAIVAAVLAPAMTSTDPFLY